jgi:GAF domain-containing protein
VVVRFVRSPLDWRQALVTPCELPESLFRYVIRTQQSVVLEDVLDQSPFAEDPYLVQRCPRSARGVPLAKQSKLMDVLYLEHN